MKFQADAQLKRKDYTIEVSFAEGYEITYRINNGRKTLPVFTTAMLYTSNGTPYFTHEGRMYYLDQFTTN